MPLPTHHALSLRHALPVSLLVAFTAACSAATAPDPDPTDRTGEALSDPYAIALWHFDEASGQAVHDAKANPADGFFGDTAVADAHDPQWAQGTTGILFNGHSSVRIPRAAKLEPQRLTLSASVKAAASPGANRDMVMKGGTGCFSLPGSYGFSTGPGGGADFYISDGTQVFTSPSALPASVWNGAWHKIVGTYDGLTVRLYVDGSQVGVGTPTGGRAIAYGGNDTTDDLVIGDMATICDYRENLCEFRDDGNPPNCYQNFVGYIDDVSVSDTGMFDRASSGAPVCTWAVNEPPEAAVTAAAAQEPVAGAGALAYFVGMQLRVALDPQAKATSVLSVASPTAPPALAKLTSAGVSVFAVDRSSVVRVDVTPSGSTQTGRSASLGRAVCGADVISAQPIVQAKALSNAAFPFGDTVYVITNHGCSDSTGNQVVALDASTLTTRWKFNFTNSYPMDASVAGCTLDYAANRLYCATRLAPGAVRATLWAIDTTTGTLLWSYNRGSLLARPELDPVARRLYIASLDGVVRAIDPDSGAEIWSTLLPRTSTGAQAVTTSFTLSTRAPYQGVLYISGGATLNALRDAGTSSVMLWSTSLPLGTGTYGARPRLVPEWDALFVGQSGGMVKQLSLRTGSDTSVFRGTFDSAMSTAFTLVYEDTEKTPSGLVIEASGASGTHVQRSCLPLM